MTLIKTDSEGRVGQPKHGFPDSIEGGDSLNWTAHKLFLRPRYSHSPALWLIDQFESKKYPGLWVRHPDPKATKNGFGSYCEGNFRGCESRDQMTGKLCLLVAQGAKGALWRSFREHLKRGLLFANNTIHNGDDPKKLKFSLYKLFFGQKGENYYKLPDVTGPDIWSLYIRGFRARALYPLLLIFDAQLLLTAVLHYFKKDSDIISHVIKVLTAQEIFPTPLGWLATKVTSQDHVLIKLMKYWCGWRQQPGMYKLYVPWIEKYWRK